MNNTVRIAVACFMGALIGTLVSLELGYMWPVGAMIGSFIAYLGFNIEEVVSAIPRAYRRATSWRPDGEYWFYWRKLFMSSFNFGFNLLMLIGLVTTPLCWLTGVNSLKIIIGFQISIALFMGTALATIASFAIMGNANHQGQWSEIYDIKHHNPNFFRLCYMMAAEEVPRIYRWLVKNIPTGFMYTLDITVDVLSFMRKFVIEFFHLIHSELRLLCAVDAGLGTAIGYFTGDALIGAIAGAILGIVNYEVISVRVLKVAGAKSILH